MAGGYFRVHHLEIGGTDVPRDIYVNKNFIAKNWLHKTRTRVVHNLTMYNNTSHQYSDQGYQNSYPSQYQQNYEANYGYHQGYGSYSTNQTQPTPPGENAYPNNWGPNSSTVNYNQEEGRKDAVAQEMQQQRAQLMTQREEYVKKASVLRRELELLRDQKQDLLSDGSRDRDLQMILKENDKLQDEIHGKLKAIINVIEMLSSIIKDGKSISDLENQFNDRSPKNSEYNPHEKNCYVHYDTGLHWCRVCDEFPETAKDFLVHLQSAKHMDNVKRNDAVDTTPWHKLTAEPLLPSYEEAPKKRVPIKGLQFFISAPSWYCKLCDIWIGDLHCASHHLKSLSHYQNYENFINQNPQWEIEWLKDRNLAKSRIGNNDSSDDDSNKKRKKRKEKKSSEEKKKKKRSKKRRKDSSDSSSSSSSSDSSSDEDDRDKTKSIRVTMRNLKAQNILDEDITGKWSVLEKLVEEHKRKEELVTKEKKSLPEDKLISQWMTVSEPPKNDKVLLDSLKDRMKVKQDMEKAKHAEMEKKRHEKERLEMEQMKRQENEVKLRQEEEERQKKRREQEEFNRILDKQRNQVKFKTFRKQRRSESEEENDDPSGRDAYRREENIESKHRSRSRSVERRSDDGKKKPPPPPSYKKLPFIGRMPLFKNKKVEERIEAKKEIKKEEYEKPRRTRFEPGNLPKAFIPRPDVVCFPKLSSIPPLTIPPPPSVKPEEPPKPPSPPKITEKEPSAPPPPIIGEIQEDPEDQMYSNEMDTEMYGGPEDNSMMEMYYNDYNQMYPQQYDYSHEENSEVAGIPLSHTLPLQPPPLPPDDDLALLGICADDMAAQSF